ncbi:hypothetical protein N9W11_06180 [Psychrosphaera haliotis]|uniref:hypothetical protein n=1 Tax=Psychrosphaera haliotis TaxID=555083 RepID=UPI00236E8120|nr:hypothetical protein [Psychrosphaera haliotis]
MKYAILFIFALFSTIVSAKPPKLSGTLTLSVTHGTIDANFTLSNIPKIKNYYIFINSGLNIQYFRDKDDGFNYSYQKDYNNEYSYESFGYYLPDKTGKGKFLPSSLTFKYTGKFPVISDMTKASDYGDWKGNIAFNGKTVRADGMQAAWYPVLYDIDKDIRFDSLVYDIEVKCADCQSIHVNGSAPVKGTSGTFSSNKAQQLMLFAGDFDIAQRNGSYFLNSRLSPNQMTKFGKVSASFERYYQKKLNLPYGEKIVFIHTTPTSKKNGWLFVAYPSIVYIAHMENGLADLINDKTTDWFKPFFAHEFAHYYFGTYRKFNSELGDMISESFSEYLSLKVTEDLIGEDAYQAIIAKKLTELANVKLTPISEINTSADYGNRNLYVYTFGSINWIMLEREIGKEKMWSWIRKLLTVESDYTNYDFLINTLGDVLNDPARLKDIEHKYFKTTFAAESNQ